MNTYLEVNDGQQSRYYYPLLTVADDQLELTITHGFRKTHLAIAVMEMEDLCLDQYLSGWRISFYYLGQRFSFFQCGSGVIDYLQTNLLLN